MSNPVNSVPGCKAAAKQTTLIRYFSSSNDGPKRKRRQLEINQVMAGENRIDEKALDGDVEEDKNHLEAVSGNGDACSTSHPTLKAPVLQTPTSPVCSSQQSDSDICNVIEPSPTAAGNNSLTLSGKIKEYQKIDRYATSQNNPAHKSSKFYESNNVGEALADMPDPVPGDFDAEFLSHSPGRPVADNAEGISEDADPYSLQPRRPKSVRIQSKSKKHRNISFYMNEIESVPRGAKIEDILQHWKGDYDKLERHHGYIQWLFPIAESGMNIEAQPLTDDEVEFFKSKVMVQNRMLRAYRMMLDFYGIELKNEGTGKLQRAYNWRERMAHLNSSFHNFLRITRILKCFGTVGLDRLQVPLVEFFIREAYTEKTLRSCQKSCRLYWVPAVTDKQERLRLDRSINNMQQQYM